MGVSGDDNGRIVKFKYVGEMVIVCITHGYCDEVLRCLWGWVWWVWWKVGVVEGGCMEGGWKVGVVEGGCGGRWV